jgi:uncharacterized protein (TIGR02996 family)
MPRGESELLDMICDAPELDEPRLAYAALLEQRGDPRGEFIRDSCTPGGEARAQELLALHAKEWAVIGLEQSHAPRYERGFIAELYLMGTFDELVLDFAEDVIALRPVPVAVILASERVLLRADNRAFAWQSRADNAILVGTLPDQHELAKAPPSPEAVQMLGFVGDSLRYRVGSDVRELRFASSSTP